MTRSLRSVPKVRPAGMLQYSTAYREECVWKRLSVLNAKGNFVAFTTVLLTPLLPSCVYIKINPPPLLKVPQRPTGLLLGLVHTFRVSTGRQLTGRTRVQLGTLVVTSPVLTGRSNDQERCDQTVVHAQ